MILREDGAHMKYIKAELEIAHFQSDDIIVTSTCINNQQVTCTDLHNSKCDGWTFFYNDCGRDAAICYEHGSSFWLYF